MDLASRTEELIRGAVEADGYELLHVEYQPHGARSVLRIYIDKPGGVNLGDCRRVSRQVSVLLDVEDLIPHQYTLEVSSPGVERRLFKPSDYRRFVGEEVRLLTQDKIEGRKKFTGFLVDATKQWLIIDCDGKRFQIPYDRIKKGNLVFHFR